MVDAGGQALVMGLVVLFLYIAIHFLVYVIPSILSVVLFYAIHKLFRNKVISFIISLLSLFPFILILESRLPQTSKDYIYYPLLKPFSVFVFVVLISIIIFLQRLSKSKNEK